jgi:hypothetical protein
MSAENKSVSSQLRSTISGPSTLQEWRDEAYELIKRAVASGEYHLLWILMGLGKTYTAGNLPADPSVSTPITVLTRQVDTREQVEAYALEAGLDASKIKVLPRFFEECPTAAGDYNDEKVESGSDITWADLMELLQSQGVSPSEIHERLGNNLPCQRSGRCPYSRACDFDIDEIELLVGHPVHAYVPSYVADRAVLFDEVAAQEFYYEVENETYTTAITTFLSDLDIPATSFDDLIRASETERSKWSQAVEDRDELIDPELGYTRSGCRADAPLLTLGVLTGTPVTTGDLTLDNLRRSEIGNRVVLYDEGKGKNDPLMMVRNPPDPLSGAAAVVAMDGTPTQAVWEGGLGLDLEVTEFMNAAERQHYIQDVLGYNIIQLTPNRTVPAAKPQNVKRWVFNGYLHEITEKHNRKPALITPKKTKNSKIDGRYVSNKELHHGKVRSHSELEDETLLAVLGSLHPGDRAIQRLAALDGYAVESNGKRGVEKSYGKIGDVYYRHEVHNEVAQAIFRVGRKADLPEAVIYVYTCLIPEWVPRDIVDTTPQRWPDATDEIADILQEREAATKQLLVNRTDCSERTIGRRLRQLRRHAYVDDVEGMSGYKEWVDKGLDERNPYGVFQIEP